MILYLLTVLLAFVLTVLAMKAHDGYVTVGDMKFAMLMSVIPIVNILFMLSGIWVMIEKWIEKWGDDNRRIF